MCRTGTRLFRGAWFAVVVAFALMPPAVRAQQESPLDSILIDGHLHTPGEIFQLLDRSAVKYLINVVPDSDWQTSQIPPVVLSPGLHPVLENGEIQYHSSRTSDSAVKCFNQGEYLYGQKEFAEARDWYRKAMEIDSEFSDPLVYIGDCFYSEGDMDSAVFYFSKGVEANPVNYQARYFLADALWERGDSATSIDVLTLAHLLNVNHEDIYSKLKRRRFALGDPWREWSFNPVCKLEQTDDGIIVETTLPFLGYALAKAVWGYEPGYADKMRDTTDTAEKYLHLMQEKEAVACAFMANDSLKTAVLDRIDLGNFSDFVLYEVISKKHPERMLLLTPESLASLAAYLDRYH